MKLKQLYTELVKAYLDDKIYNWNYGEDDDNVYLIQDEHALWVIPKSRYPFHNERLFEKAPFHSQKRLLQSAYDGVTLELTSLILSEGKQKLHLLKSEKFDIYLSDQYLKYLEGDLTFRANDNRSPVFCFENDTLVGMILPVVRK